jgi:hypothetical protein
MPPLPPYTISEGARAAMTREQISESEVRAALQQWWDSKGGNPSRSVHIWPPPIQGITVTLDYKGPGQAIEVIRVWRTDPFSTN